MHIVRFRVDGKTRYGVLDGAGVVEYAGAPWSLFRRGRRRYSLRQVVLPVPAAPASGRLEPGDRVEIRLEGVGALKNTIVRV